MNEVYTVDSIRQAEEPLLAAQSVPDELMTSAATAVARTAAALLGPHPTGPVVILAGSGGNGGDALYAGAILRDFLPDIDLAAILLGTPHPPALQAFQAAGGHLIAEPPANTALTIDGILGIGGRGGLRDRAAELANALPRPILSVDVPSGLPADAASPADIPNAPVIRADVTITFGGLRQVHASSTLCGHVLCADIQLRDGTSLADSLTHFPPVAHLYRAVVPNPLDYELPAYPHRLDVSPDATDDKYSGGVVGLATGSDTYPGAGILATGGAVSATSSMVRAVGGIELVRAHPEIIVSDSVATTGRVQAWAVGSGRGTGPAALQELLTLISTDLPLLIDADALTLLGRHRDLGDLLRSRSATTVLTPHAGEFARLPGNTPEELARDLGVIVLLKGRLTRITDGVTTVVIDAGHSWSATPGSGDVLSGILGAHLARVAATDHAAALREIVAGQLVHSVAAWLAAQTPDGPAPTTASRIIAAIPQANARLS